MLAITANDAKTQLGDMMVKLQFLQTRAAKTQEEIQSNNTVDGEQFFNELENGQHD
jgi:hypothetical protein